MYVTKVVGKVFALNLLDSKVRRLKVGDNVTKEDRVLVSKDTSIEYAPDFSDRPYAVVNYEINYNM